MAYFLSRDYLSYINSLGFFIYFLFLSDEGPTLETLDYTIRTSISIYINTDGHFPFLNYFLNNFTTVLFFFFSQVSQFEGKPKGSTVAFLSVTDEDMGDNGEFFCRYENIDPEEFGKFEVKTVTKGCEVRNTEILDWFLGKNVYSLRVRVIDKASPRQRKSDVIKVTVKVRW